MYIFGGINERQEKFNDLHQLNLQRWEWRQINTSNKTSPIERTFHQMESWGDKVLIFGGLAGYKLNDTHFIEVQEAVAQTGNYGLMNRYNGTK